MKHLYFSAFILLIFFASCGETHLLKDRNARANIKQMLEKQKELFADNSNNLFAILDRDLSREERDALEFLYAYMPLNDLLDYSGDFFYAQTKAALNARREMSWGESIPNELFYHFVLPYRSGNENLDSFRITIYDELKHRVQGMGMKEAALEVNHWCHEKVTYQSTDSRTSSPLALMKTSWGRCGEEAAFTVAAMRTVGIPARQCYTPRWAHTDDNHAWVEVWIDGGWHFMGACEPESDLNMGWFAEPARRAMLVNASVYGKYDGEEAVDVHSSKNAILNITGNYAPVKEVFFRVLNKDNQPVPEAKVSVKVFNYGELSTLQTKKADRQGKLSMTSGLGDYVVWATDGTQFGFKKVNVPDADTVEIIISDSPETVRDYQFSLEPPIAPEPKVVNESKAEENKQRLQKEDEIRKSYMATFPDSTKVAELISPLGFSMERAWPLIRKSAGNWKEIILFMEQARPNKPVEAIELLEAVSEKDLRDTPASVLFDHLHNATVFQDEWKNKNYSDYLKYVLNPRVANEKLVAYRGYLQLSFSENQKILFHADPTSLFRWTKEKIRIIEDEDFSRIVISPIGVMKGMISDLHSLNVFFVAACRTFGIPARMNQKSFIPEYFVRNEWRSVRFTDSEEVVLPKGFVQFDARALDFVPAYQKHWTLAKFENGIYRTIGLSRELRHSSINEKIELEVGNYMLTTGNRQQNGTVPCLVHFFAVKENETSNIVLNFNDSEEELQMLGSLKLPKSIKALSEDREILPEELFSAKQLVLIWIDPDKEPSKHVLNEIIALKREFEAWGGKILLFRSNKATAVVSPEILKVLPVNCILAEDHKSEIIQSVTIRNQNVLSALLPVNVLVDEAGQIYYYSSGYKIGTGEHLLKTIRSLSSK